MFSPAVFLLAKNGPYSKAINEQYENLNSLLHLISVTFNLSNPTIFKQLRIQAQWENGPMDVYFKNAMVHRLRFSLKYYILKYNYW